MCVLDQVQGWRRSTSLFGLLLGVPGDVNLRPEVFDMSSAPLLVKKDPPLGESMRIPFQRLGTVTRVLVALWAVAGAYGQVLNLSHDLVARGIAPSNMTPDTPSLDSRPLFQAGVAYASLNHIPSVIADSGRYYFLSLNSPYQHVFLNAPENVTVDLQGSDLFFVQGNTIAIDISNSMNFTLKNLTIDYLSLPFTQMTVTGVSSLSPPTIDFKPNPGYALPSSFNALTVPPGVSNDGYYVYVFRNGQELGTTGRMSVASGPLNDSTLQLAGVEPWTQAAQLDTIEPGDTLALEWRAGAGAIFTTGSTGLTLQNISVYSSGFIAVNVILGSASTVDHVQVIPRPGTDRMISSNADGIHLSKAGANNRVTNNIVTRTCDDAIAIDGQWYAIVSAGSNTATVPVTRNNTGMLAIGQAFDFINILNATIAGTATIVDENPEPASQTGEPGEAITLTLDAAIPGLQANFGVTPHDVNLRGSGTEISGNLAQEIVFGRGIYPAGVANVTISGNITEKTNRTGIIVEQDEGRTYSYKTGPSSGITIENNIVDGALEYGVPSAGVLTDGAAINVVAYDENFDWVSTQSLSNIRITNNLVTNTIHTGIRMVNVSNGAVTGNVIVNYGTQPDSDIWYLPVCPICESLVQIESDFTLPVLVSDSTSVTNANNIGIR